MLRTAALAFAPAFGLLVLAASTTLAQPQAIHREVLQSQDVPSPSFKSELMRVRVDKGGLVARHTHPGLEIGYVEDGQALVKVQGQPERTLTKGGSFSVLGGTPHSVQNTGPGELTILSTYVVDRSKPLATPAP
jgi:quercetin dioxygenase-like cupin family protein